MAGMLKIPSETPFLRKLPSGWFALILGGSAAAMAATLISVHWTLVVVACTTIFYLSVVEWEPFILAVIFLLPLSWRLPSDYWVREVPAGLHLLVTIGYFFGRSLSGRLKLRELCRHPISWASLLLLCAALLSAIFGSEGWTHLSARACFFFVSYIGFYFVVGSWISSHDRLMRVLYTLLASLTVVGAFAVYQQILGDYGSFWYFFNPPDENSVSWINRSASFLNYSNTLGGYLDLVLPLALAFSILGRQRWKKLGRYSLGFGSAALVCSQSRGAVVAFACVLLLAISFFVRSWRKRFILIGGLVLITVGFYVAASIWSPEHFGDIDENSAVGRLMFWGLALQMFAGSPLLGIGLGNFQGVYGDYIQGVSWLPPMVFSVHNVYLQLLSETGLLGFSGFFLLLFFTTRQAIQQWRCSTSLVTRILGFGVLAAIVATLVHGFVDAFLGLSEFGTVFWVLLALLAANSRLSARQVDFAEVYASRVPTVPKPSFQSGI